MKTNEIKYERTELFNLAESNNQYVEVAGIARATKEAHYLGVPGNPYGFYSALLQSLTDKNFFVIISGIVKNEDGLSDVLSMLGASSETGLPITIKGENGTSRGIPRVNHIDKITLGNLIYQY